MRGTRIAAVGCMLMAAAAEAKQPKCFKGTDARTGVEIAVNELGKVTGCTVVISSGSPEHDAASCKVSLPQLGIKPAIKGGKPAASTARYWVSWMCPDLDAPRRPGDPFP